MHYSLSRIAEITGGRFCGADLDVDTIVTDSRHSLGNGATTLFAAMKGINQDGHNFIADLYRRSVRAFLVEEAVDTTQYPEAGFVVVGRTLRALQALAADWRRQFGGTVVAVAGSEGKSVVKEWIAQAAPAQIKVFRSPRSYNSQLGAALSLLMIEGDETMAVIEAGISKPDEMERLSEMIAPDVAVMTTLSREHSENFDSEQQKADQKALICRTCHTVIYNSAYPLLADAVARYAGRGCRLIDSNGYTVPIESSDPKMAADAAQVALLLKEAGCTKEQIDSGIGRLQPVGLELLLSEGTDGSIVVSDNHQTDLNSLSIALDYLVSVAADKPLQVVLSDIPFVNIPDRELYQRVNTMLKNAGVGKIYGIGRRIGENSDLFECEGEFYLTAEQMIASFDRQKSAGKAILVKGDRMAHLERIVHLLQLKSHTTVWEIDLDAMAHNLNFYRSKLETGCKLMCMVKASAYGHGDFEVTTLLERQGVDYVAVAFADEGVRLRQKGIRMPIVVLNADDESFEIMITHHLEPEIYSLHSFDRFVAAVVREGESSYPIHIKIDSGMHRLGFEYGDLDELIERLKRYDTTVKVRSIFSHLATADMPQQRDFTLRQIGCFDRCCIKLESALPYRPLRHIDNSAAIVHFPRAHYQMCRLGIGLYGVGEEELKPVSRLKTRIVQIKHLDRGETVGYGRQGVIERPTVTATIPIGYADGMDRRLGNGRWSVVVAGKKAPIVGRVCMDSCMIDITGIEGVGEGDEAIIFGASVDGNSIEDMARVLDTIPYEIMTSVSQRVKRIYIQQ